MQSPSWSSSQLPPASVHGLSPSLFPSLRLQATRSLWCHSNLVWQGREPLSQPKNPVEDVVGHRAWGCSHPGPRACPRDLIVLKNYPYHLIFPCPLQFLVSTLHICWGTIGCLVCSSVDWLGVSPMWRGKWTLFSPISPPSSQAYHVPYFLDYKTHFPLPKFGKKMGVCLVVRM